MRKYSIVLIVAALLSGILRPALAGDQNIPTKGTDQIMFGLSGWDLAGYRGGIGLRTYLRDNLALRIGGDFGWANQTREDLDGNLGSLQKIEYSNFSIGLGAALERYFDPAWNVTPFLGFGLFANYENPREKATWVDPYNRRTTTEEDVYSIESRLMMGFQWHFTRNLSLGGEYFLAYAYTYREQVSQEVRGEPFPEDKRTTKGSAVNVDTSRLWVSVGF